MTDSVKTCTKCGKEYARTLENFYSHKTTRDGLQSRCKGCLKESAVRSQTGTTRGKIRNYKTDASRRNHQWSLTDDQAAALMRSPCAYCKKPADPLNGIDRVNNDLGYLPENCVACCKDCNQMKHARTAEDFLAHVRSIYRAMEPSCV